MRKPKPNQAEHEALQRVSDEQRHRVLDAAGAQKIGSADADAYNVNGRPLLVVRYPSVPAFDVFVPLSSTGRADTLASAARSWARLDTRTPDVRKVHPDMPAEHEARPMPVTPITASAGARVGLDNGEAPTRWYTTAEARALAWELLHAADKADDAAAEATGKMEVSQ